MVNNSFKGSRLHDTYNRREVWRGNTFVKDIIEIDVLEERMPLDFLSISFTGAESTIWITR